VLITNHAPDFWNFSHYHLELACRSDGVDATRRVAWQDGRRRCKKAAMAGNGGALAVGGSVHAPSPAMKKAPTIAGLPRLQLLEKPLKQAISSLLRLNLGSLRALGAVCDNVADALVLFQRAETRTLDLGEVSEQILTTRVRSNKAIALFRVEPLNDAGFFHTVDPCIKGQLKARDKSAFQARERDNGETGKNSTTVPIPHA
jgi:hypothetical protein